ncbi:dienelactone hydrolase family protein [Bradyrhizobium cenepequi]
MTWSATGVLLAFAAALAIGLATEAPAQDRPAGMPSAWSPEAIYRGATLAADLAFPDAPQTDAGSAPRMLLLKPEGEGPFPGIVMVHQCAGLNPAVMASARKAVAAKYAVLVLDSFTQRGVSTVCFGPEAGINFFRGARDALQAAEHLRHQPYVDKDRIALVGFSWGAVVGLLASSPHYVGALRGGPAFAAVASFYPGCFRILPPGRPPIELVNADISRPLLVLMGGADTETPAAECVEKLATLKKSGAPVEWHVYPDTTHCWDCQQLDGRSKIDVRGNRVEYRFSRAATDDAQRRLFEFLRRVMPQA